MKSKYNNCTLEIHEHRGVIYVHSKKGKTLIRIQGLTKSQCEPATGMIDLFIGDRHAALASQVLEGKQPSNPTPRPPAFPQALEQPVHPITDRPPSSKVQDVVERLSAKKPKPGKASA